MAVQRQVAFWLAALTVVILVIVLLHQILLPFVAGLFLAYVFDPLARRLQRLRVGRLASTIIVLGLFVLFFILALILIVPVIANQLASFIDNLPATLIRLQQLAMEQGGPLIERLGGRTAIADIQKSAGNFVSQGAAWLVGFLGSIWAGGQALIGIVSLIVVTPVVAFYLLMDWDRMIAAVDGWVPLKQRDTVRALARDIDRAIAGFLRGQALVCLILGTFYALALSLVGLNFGALIGVGTGILGFVPYVGALAGFVVSIIVAIVQFWPGWTMIAAVVLVFGVGQFLEGNILSPKLVGGAIGVHPVWLMFALFAFGSLFGFVGLLLAVPSAAAVGVLARFALRQYLASPLYRGDDGREEPERRHKNA